MVSQVVPKDLSGLFVLNVGLDGGNVVEPLVVVLDGLQVASELDALGEGVLGGFEDLVVDAVLQSGQEELVLDEFEGIGDAISTDVGWGSSNGGSKAAMAAGFLSIRCL